MSKKKLYLTLALVCVCSVLCGLVFLSPAKQANAEVGTLDSSFIVMSEWSHADRPITIKFRYDYNAKDGQKFTEKSTDKVTYTRGNTTVSPNFTIADGYYFHYGFKIDGMEVKTPVLGDVLHFDSDFAIVYDGTTYSFGGARDYVYNGVAFVSVASGTPTIQRLRTDKVGISPWSTATVICADAKTNWSEANVYMPFAMGIKFDVDLNAGITVDDVTKVTYTRGETTVNARNFKKDGKELVCFFDKESGISFEDKTAVSGDVFTVKDGFTYNINGQKYSLGGGFSATYNGTEWKVQYLANKTFAIDEFGKSPWTENIDNGYRFYIRNYAEGNNNFKSPGMFVGLEFENATYVTYNHGGNSYHVATMNWDDVFVVFTFNGVSKSPSYGDTIVIGKDFKFARYCTNYSLEDDTYFFYNGTKWVKTSALVAETMYKITKPGDYYVKASDWTVEGTKLGIQVYCSTAVNMSGADINDVTTVTYTRGSLVENISASHRAGNYLTFEFAGTTVNVGQQANHFEKGDKIHVSENCRILYSNYLYKFGEIDFEYDGAKWVLCGHTKKEAVSNGIQSSDWYANFASTQQMMVKAFVQDIDASDNPLTVLDSSDISTVKYTSKTTGEQIGASLIMRVGNAIHFGFSNTQTTTFNADNKPTEGDTITIPKGFRIVYIPVANKDTNDTVEYTFASEVSYTCLGQDLIWYNSATLQHTVTFNPGNGLDSWNETVNHGEKVNQPTNPVKEGYRFVKWVDANQTEYNFDTAVTDNLTLTAQYVKQYTVTFNPNNGQASWEEKVDDGATVSAPTEPQKEGYTFVCWRAMGNTYNFGQIVTSDITLIASYVDDFGIRLKYMNVNLGDKISAIFYFEIGDDFKTNHPDAFIDFNVGSGDYEINESVKVADADEKVVDEVKYYVYEVKIGSAQMADAISIRFNDGTSYSNVTRTYSVRDYALKVISSSSDDLQIELAKQMLNYGAYAQIYFNYNKLNLANEGVDMSKNIDTVTSIPCDANLVTGSATGFNGVSQVTAILDYVTSFRLVCDYENGYTKNDFDFEISYLDEDGEKVTVTDYVLGDDYIDIRVASQYISSKYTVKITNKTNKDTYTVTTSLSYYLKSTLENSQDVNLVNLCKAIYLYNQSAIDYLCR